MCNFTTSLINRGFFMLTSPEEFNRKNAEVFLAKGDMDTEIYQKVVARHSCDMDNCLRKYHRVNDRQCAGAHLHGNEATILELMIEHGAPGVRVEYREDGAVLLSTEES